MADSILKVITMPVVGDIFVDNEYRGSGNIEITQISTGNHTVAFGDVPGYYTPQSINIVIEQNKEILVQATYVKV